jgi:peptide deformylase
MKTMALRNIVTQGDVALTKKCREVTDFNDRIKQLIDDLGDTLLESGGVGLAAPQVGVLRRVIVVLETNVDEDEDEILYELVNPEIIEQSGEQSGPEGCLSVPGVYGIVTRPEYVKVRAYDRDGEQFEVEAHGLTARCFCHEIDHLDGHLFTEKAERILDPEEIAEDGEE